MSELSSRESIAAIVMAAGKGTRMKSDRAKVLHNILGRPMVFYVLDALRAVEVERSVIVVGHCAESVREACGSAYKYAEQIEQHGTGHAIQTAMPALDDFEGRVLILSGDMPLITREVLEQLIEASQKFDNDLTILTADTQSHRDFGRIIRAADGTVTRITEAKDATPVEYAVTEINLGAYCAKASFLREFLPKLETNNAQGELYLTDLVTLGSRAGRRVNAVTTEDLECALGINNRADLAQAASVVNRRQLRNLMMSGVTIIDPASCWVEPSVSVGCNCELWPGTILQGQTVIGENCVIGPNTRISDSTVGNNNNITYSVLTEAKVGNSINIGPFAYLRPHAEIADNAKVGDFVEIKNSYIGQGSKVPHLTYVGDADVGSKTNIGCGTITCNYDGKNKHRTEIGDGVFIGSNTSLVAPVKVGNGALTGAGSVITKDVPDHGVVVGVPAKPIKK